MQRQLSIGRFNLPDSCVIVLLVAVFLSTVAAQDKTADAILFDEFASVNECDFKGRTDGFMAELAKNSEYEGYIINYESVDKLPGESSIAGRERAIASFIAFRNFDRSRITLVRGGYRSQVFTELWLVPPRAPFPEPSKTLPEPAVPIKTTHLYAKRLIDLQDTGFFEEEFVLPSVKQDEQTGPADETSPDEDDDTSVVGEPLGGAESDDTQSVDSEKEEGEQDRFQWANVGIARLVASEKGASAVIIFYADDRRYDISNVMDLIERGRDLLAEHGDLDKARLSVVFGGYRETPEVEFWFVPSKGKGPLAKSAQSAGRVGRR